MITECKECEKLQKDIAKLRKEIDSVKEMIIKICTAVYDHVDCD